VAQIFLLWVAGFRVGIWVGMLRLRREDFVLRGFALHDKLLLLMRRRRFDEDGILSHATGCVSSERCGIGGWPSL
jgi:hypothetical protein